MENKRKWIILLRTISPWGSFLFTDWALGSLGLSFRHIPRNTTSCKEDFIIFAGRTVLLRPQEFLRQVGERFAESLALISLQVARFSARGKSLALLNPLKISRRFAQPKASGYAVLTTPHKIANRPLSRTLTPQEIERSYLVFDRKWNWDVKNPHFLLKHRNIKGTPCLCKA